ncbi:hypothetical protein CY34DRAFT_742581 [Suillus luteus UH-Slu-Lm8-n1]|uniref:Uncharacterized protein n=1 Tax=Suillus luteus UH-Slu-Lm8-n1 TaxID=930992 RepID=A0A0D0A442_9AGAM|nr:hypothetical protein CY34DRAFT_742581 [Suillus luteus UH-Slu-Lm8-n1]
MRLSGNAEVTDRSCRLTTDVTYQERIILQILQESGKMPHPNYVQVHTTDMISPFPAV